MIDEVIRIKKEYREYMTRNPELLQNRKQYIEWVIQYYSKTEPTKQITTIVRELSRWHLFVSERSIWRELKS